MGGVAEVDAAAPADDGAAIVGAGNVSASSVSAANGPLFRRADLSSFRAEPDRFYDSAYSPTLRAMVQAVLDCEAPVRDDVRAQRIARAHGWLRTGGTIRAHIERHLKGLDATREEGGRFLWRAGQRSEPLLYRQPASEYDRRPVGEIALLELAAAVIANSEIMAPEDPALTFARMIGLNRLTTPSRARLDAAIALASTNQRRTKA